MTTNLPSLGGQGGTALVLTDSGLGGLLVCADLESRLRRCPGEGAVSLTYVNAWPEEGCGYNDLPDIEARAAVFDRALTAMMSFEPSAIVIACNTLSVVYRATAFGRAPQVPVEGILDAGVELFHEALKRDDEGVLALFGTRTTIASGEHAGWLVGLGIDPRRIVTESCHGLAAAIDRDPDSPDVPGLVDACVLRASPRLPLAGTLYAGLACTHYSYVSEIFRSALARHAGDRVEILEPGMRLVDRLTEAFAPPPAGAAGRTIAVEVVSKVKLAEAQRTAVARRLESISPATARALREYRHVPDLFRGVTP
jgi:glutamate racemase